MPADLFRRVFFGIILNMKIVIDTNTLINAATDDYNFGNRIIDQVLSGKIQAFANPQTIKENRLLTNRKISDQDYLQKLTKYYDAIIPVESEYINVVEDSEDNKILASALTANAEYLITDDWHLLKLAEYQGVKMVSPAQFWSIYEQETGSGWQKWLADFIQ